jgi:hypothetical protein
MNSSRLGRTSRLPSRAGQRRTASSAVSAGRSTLCRVLASFINILLPALSPNLYPKSFLELKIANLNYKTLLVTHVAWPDRLDAFPAQSQNFDAAWVSTHRYLMTRLSLKVVYL